MMRKEFLWFLRVLAIAGLVCFVVIIQIYLFCGSLVGLDRLMTPQEVSFKIDKNFSSPEGNTVQIIVSNKTAKPISLMGGKTDCKCGAVEKFPLSIPAFSDAMVLFLASEDVDWNERAKQKQKIVFFIDSGGTQRAAAELPLFEFLARR